MIDIKYTTIKDPEDIETALMTIDKHFTGHVYMLQKRCIQENEDDDEEEENKWEVILGHNANHDNIASFGGFSNPGESLFNTINREFEEETLGVICDSNQLLTLLRQHSVMITRTSRKGQHYTLFCDATSLSIDNKKIESDFEETRRTNKDTLTKDQLENDKICIVSLGDIKYTIMSSLANEKDAIVIDQNKKPQLIRDINLAAYKWLFDDYLTTQKENNKFISLK